MTGVRGAAVAAPLASLPVAVYCPSELMIASFQEMRCSESLVEGRLAADSVNGCLDFDCAADAIGYLETEPARGKVIIKVARSEKVGETMRPSNVGRSAGRVLRRSRRAGRSTLVAGEGFPRLTAAVREGALCHGDLCALVARVRVLAMLVAIDQIVSERKPGKKP